MPRKHPGTVWGRALEHPRTSQPDLCVTPHKLDRMSPGQPGHFHGTNGTRPRDDCGPEVGVSRRISLYVYCFFSLPILGPLGLTTKMFFELKRSERKALA